MNTIRDRNPIEQRLAADVDQLCSDEFLPRNTGARGAANAASFLASRLETLGLAASGETGYVQEIPDIGASNVLGAIPGATERWVVVGAHYDACGWEIPGANDNAAGVAIVLEVARRLRDTELDHSILIALFDAEEPPNFLTPYMGSQWFVDHPTMPLDRIDTMVCLDLVGHALGPASLPSAIRDSVFVLGAEKGSGTPELFDSLPTVDGIIPRRVDNYIVPAMSDYYAFMNRSIPFLFYTGGRNADYHMPTDTPDKLDYSKMAALVDHLTLLLEKLGRRPDPPSYVHGGVDDEATVRTMSEITEALRPYASDAGGVESLVDGWRETLDRNGSLTQQDRQAVAYVIFQVEEALA